MLKSSKPVLAATLFVTGLAVGTLSSHFDTSQPTGGLENAVNKVVQQVSPQSDLASFNQLAKQLKPSVVNISVVKRGSAPFYPGRSFELDGQGSGLILTSDGEILTNAHVVDGASEIVVKLHDGREIPANIVGTDSTTDLALLKMENVSDLQAVTLGDSEALEVGEWVMAIGNPFGLEETVTVGVLSAKGRVIGAGPYDDFLQTDTSINPGNSGGPLFNIKGEVVGINTAILKQGQGIGFSIPVNLAKQISDQLRSKGMVTRGYLGIGIQPLTPALKKSLSLAPETQGAIVASVQPQGPAAPLYGQESLPWSRAQKWRSPSSEIEMKRKHRWSLTSAPERNEA
ncbi:MAG TPA: trypsin-like serine protease [Phycisphaerales bacterium]|nr:trypsin-like serine protease [Phycisphaerales bacterium]